MAGGVNNVYAEAMFQLCEEQGSLEAVFEELNAVGEIFEENTDLVKLLKSPLIGFDEKTRVIENVFGGKISDVAFDFLCLVTQKGRADCISGICREFKKLYYKKNNILEVSVVTASPLSERLERKLKDKLSATLGKKIIMQKSVDKSLIGGIIVRYDNSEIDSSVSGRLEKLKEQIDSVIA